PENLKEEIAKREDHLKKFKRELETANLVNKSVRTELLKVEIRKTERAIKYLKQKAIIMEEEKRNQSKISRDIGREYYKNSILLNAKQGYLPPGADELYYEICRMRMRFR
ncbi:unnamed protein product, partial [marine sediment metagenome]